jgi:DNA-binding NtrC family response regulator
VVPIAVPPLRERREDVPLLAAHILARRRGAAKTFAGEEARYPTRISTGAMARLLAYHWPGNIRELENVLSRAAILCDGEEIRADDLELVGLHAAVSGPPALAAVSGPPAAGTAAGRPLKELVEDTVRTVEREAIAEALRRCEGSPTRAARMLGISRASIYNKIKDYGLQ